MAIEHGGKLREVFDKVVSERNLLLVRFKEQEQQLAQAREEIETLRGFVEESKLTNQRLREHGTTHAQHLEMELRLQERVREGLRAENAQARALLEALTSTDPSGYGAESSILHCPYCEAREDRDDFPVDHAPECPWLKIRAFLAQQQH
jgi:hypothetical protein